MEPTKKRINIAIDGHSSCGKSTIAKKLAQTLGFTYIDTGAMYRAVTLYSIRHHYWMDDQTPDVNAVVASLGEIHLVFKWIGEVQHIYLNGEDVENEIRQLEVSSKVSHISVIPEVRNYLVSMQQSYAIEKGVVMDGRDIGTTVLPTAELKVFVTARPDVRAKRRFIELKSKGEDVTYERILENLMTRDHIDSTREASPLQQAEDAILLDNSDMTLLQQQEWITSRAFDVINT